MIISFIELAHYGIAAILVVVPAFCVSYGQGAAAQEAIEGIQIQPGARSAIMNALVIGAVLNETAALLSVIVGVAVLVVPTMLLTWPVIILECGMGLAVGIPAMLVGYFSSLPHRAILQSVTRQPFQSGRMNYFLAFVLSMMQMSVILGLIIALVIRFGVSPELSYAAAWRMCAMGLAFGLSTVGPLIGMQRFSRTACAVLGSAPDSYSSVVSFSLVSQALIETPVLFALFIAFLILFRSGAHPWAAVASALAIGLSTLGAGIASGTIASAACRAMGTHQDQASLFSYTSVFAQTLVDALVVYGVIIAVILLLVG